MRPHALPVTVISIVFLLGAAAVIVYGPVSAVGDDTMIVEDIHLEPRTLLLESGCYVLSMGVSDRQLEAIQMERTAVDPPRPMTHDLLLNVLETEGSDVDSVLIHGIVNGSYQADIITSTGNTIDARPSDAVAVAVRADVDIHIDRELMRDAGVDACERPEDAYQL